MVRSNQGLSEGPSVPVRQAPPQVPTFSMGVITIGSFGRRCSMGGSLPSLTSCARSGDSLYLPGAAPAPPVVGAGACPPGAAVGAPAGGCAPGAQPAAAARAPTILAP